MVHKLIALTRQLLFSSFFVLKFKQERKGCKNSYKIMQNCVTCIQDLGLLTALITSRLDTFTGFLNRRSLIGGSA